MEDSTAIAPIVSRLDRLDFIMKNLEKRTSKKSNNVSGVKEDEPKGCLVDRVESLETRLLQVKRAIQIEMESSGSNSRTSQTSRDSSCPLPTFANTRLSQLHEIEEKSEEDEPEVNLIPPKPTTKKNTKKKNGKSCKTDKKRNSPGWLHMRLLGC